MSKCCIYERNIGLEMQGKAISLHVFSIYFFWGGGLLGDDIIYTLYIAKQVEAHIPPPTFSDCVKNVTEGSCLPTLIYTLL